MSKQSVPKLSYNLQVHIGGIQVTVSKSKAGKQSTKTGSRTIENNPNEYTEAVCRRLKSDLTAFADGLEARYNQQG